MKTIESLINTNKKVYVRMSSDEICRRFFAQAEREGFLFGGENPTDKHPSDLIAVLPDKRLCYVGTIGRIAAGSGAENVVVLEGEEVLAAFNSIIKKALPNVEALSFCGFTFYCIATSKG